MGKYDHLERDALIRLLEQRDAERQHSPPSAGRGSRAAQGDAGMQVTCMPSALKPFQRQLCRSILARFADW